MRRDPIQTAHARDLRANETSAERRLWSVLRAKQIGGFKFRRQHPIGQYIVDFVCLSARLVIEVDGDTHGEDREVADSKRTVYIESLGFRVLRFWNTDVFDSIDGVADSIAYELGMFGAPLRQTFPAPTPLPRGRGDI